MSTHTGGHCCWGLEARKVSEMCKAASAVTFPLMMIQQDVLPAAPPTTARRVPPSRSACKPSYAEARAEPSEDDSSSDEDCTSDGGSAEDVPVGSRSIPEGRQRVSLAVAAASGVPESSDAEDSRNKAAVAPAAAALTHHPQRASLAAMTSEEEDSDGYSSDCSGESKSEAFDDSGDENDAPNIAAVANTGGRGAAGKAVANGRRTSRGASRQSNAAA